MEEQKTMEQPEPNLANVNEQIIDEKGDSENGAGSIFGKFKDATSLLSAYNNLEKEFTRKSQLLSNITKEVELLKTQNDTINNENIALKTQNATEKADVKEDLQLDKPQYCSQNWKRKVSDFLSKNPSAQDYTSEISKILLEHSDLSKLDNCLEYAYSIAKSQNPKPANLNDQTINNFVNDARIKDKIIKSYLLELKQNKTGLPFISGEAKDVAFSPSQDKPKNLKEASNILKKLLQS